MKWVDVQDIEAVLTYHEMQGYCGANDSILADDSNPDTQDALQLKMRKLNAETLIKEEIARLTR